MHTYEEEILARALAPMLEAALGDVQGSAVQVAGAGVHWNLKAAAGDRACKVHCLHYGDSSPFGELPNQHLRLVSAAPPPIWRSGAEYYLELERAQQILARGRTRDADATIDAVRRWLLGAELDELHGEHPFVDEPKRTYLRLTHALEQALARAPIDARVALEAQYGDCFELWTYGAARSCRLDPLDGGAVGCALCIRTSQVASVRVADPERAAALVREWIADAVALADVRELHSSAELLPHAELLERGDVAGWSWASLLERAPALHRPLIEKIVQHPAVSRFFAFTSLHRLCFSRCSHYPFATDGMPMVFPVGDADSPRYAVVVEDQPFEGGVETTLAVLERVLATVDETPWHGVAAEALIAPINQALADRGTDLRLAARQRMQWLAVVACSDAGRVTVDATTHGEAYCELQLDGIAGKQDARPRSAAEAAEQIIAWLGSG